MADPIAVGGLVLGAVGTILGVYNAVIGWRKHTWEAEDRAKETKHRKWTEEMRELALYCEPALLPIPVKEEDMASALWAAEKGLLKLIPSSDVITPPGVLLPEQRAFGRF